MGFVSFAFQVRFCIPFTSMVYWLRPVTRSFCIYDFLTLWVIYFLTSPPRSWVRCSAFRDILVQPTGFQMLPRNPVSVNYEWLSLVMVSCCTSQIYVPVLSRAISLSPQLSMSLVVSELNYDIGVFVASKVGDRVVWFLIIFWRPPLDGVDE